MISHRFSLFLLGLSLVLSTVTEAKDPAFFFVDAAGKIFTVQRGTEIKSTDLILVPFPPEKLESIDFTVETHEYDLISKSLSADDVHFLREHEEVYDYVWDGTGAAYIFVRNKQTHHIRVAGVKRLGEKLEPITEYHFQHQSAQPGHLGHRYFANPTGRGVIALDQHSNVLSFEYPQGSFARLNMYGPTGNEGHFRHVNYSGLAVGRLSSEDTEPGTMRFFMGRNKEGIGALLQFQYLPKGAQESRSVKLPHGYHPPDFPFQLFHSTEVGAYDHLNGMLEKMRSDEARRTRIAEERKESSGPEACLDPVSE